MNKRSWVQHGLTELFDTAIVNVNIQPSLCHYVPLIPSHRHRGVKADWAAKITGHCSGEAASDGRPHHQDATWTTSQSCYVMDSSWKWQETRSANKDMAVHIQRRPCGQRSQSEQRPGCGYRQAQMANSCCPLS